MGGGGGNFGKVLTWFGTGEPLSTAYLHTNKATGEVLKRTGGIGDLGEAGEYSANHPWIDTGGAWIKQFYDRYKRKKQYSEDMMSEARQRMKVQNAENQRLYQATIDKIEAERAAMLAKEGEGKIRRQGIVPYQQGMLTSRERLLETQNPGGSSRKLLGVG